MPNFNDSFFSSSSIDCSNTYYGLTDSLVDSDVTFDLCSGSDGNPKTSTPTKDDIHVVGQKPNKYHKNKKHTIKGMIINCNSLRSGDKQAAFHSIIEHHQPDIVLGCESKIDNTYATYEVFPDNFTVYRKDRTAGGGGVFIATRDSLITSSEPSLDGDCEIVGANIEFANSRPLFVASFYRPPGSNCQPLDALSNIFSNLVSKNRRQHPNVIIGGDYNFPDIDWPSWKSTSSKTKSYHDKFLEFLLENSLAQLQEKVTRPISNSVLDLLVTTNPNLVDSVPEVFPGMSDHCLVTFDINMKPKLRKKTQRKIFMYHKANLSTLKQDTLNFASDFLNSNPLSRSVNANWESIRDKVTDLANKHIPSKLSKTKHNLPWVNVDVKRKMRKRDRLFSKARRSNSSHDWKIYRSYRNYVTKVVRNAHRSYINTIIGPQLTENPKRFYSYINLRRTESMGVPILKTSNKMCSTDKAKAEALNCQFQSVFTKPSNTQVEYDAPSPYSSIPHLVISNTGVVKQLSGLKVSKSCGPDEISPHFLKLVAEEIAPVFTFLFQQSFDNNTIPDQWRFALVTPIYKNGPKSDPANYRPISLTCISCKICEHIVLSHVAKHLNSNKIILDDQHGFRERLSTITQLINCTNDWVESLNRRSQTDVILLDFSKAFDRVPHHLLLAKLSYYGIRNNTFGWINAFLSHRRQSVSVNGTHSSWVDVTSGVPQGSVLGPALFLIYINDINNDIQSKLKLFADDSGLYREINCPEDHMILQNDLNTLAAWSDKWLMSFNIKKCVVMSITRKHKPSLYQYKLCGEDLSHVTKHDYLGVTISQDLRWNDHVTKITRKASQTLGLLRRQLSPCSRDVKTKAYEALVRPKLEYASQIWNPNTLKDIKRIEQVQRNAARFVFADYRKTTSVTPLINQLDWDTLHTRRLIHQATMFYRIHYGLVNISPPACFQRATHIFRFDHPLKYVSTFRPVVNVYKFAFYPRVVQIWNRLPPSAVLHINPTTTAFQDYAIPAIRDMKPLGENNMV